MPLPWGLDYIQKEWSVIKKIPITIVIIIGITFSINYWIFKERLTAKDDLIVSYKEKLGLQSEDKKAVISTSEEPFPNWKEKIKKPIIGKTFKNERVELDGFSFIKCKFINVTFVYKGEAPFDMVNIEYLGDHSFDVTSNRSFSGLVQLLRATDHLKNLNLNDISKD